MSDEQFFNRFLDRIIGPDLPGDREEPEGENKVVDGDDEGNAVVDEDEGNASRRVSFFDALNPYDSQKTSVILVSIAQVSHSTHLNVPWCRNACNKYCEVFSSKTTW